MVRKQSCFTGKPLASLLQQRASMSYAHFDANFGLTLPCKLFFFSQQAVCYTCHS